MSLTPPIGVSGIYQLASPYSADVVQGVSYTCIAVRKFDDILKLGVDPFLAYYSPKQISEAEYMIDYQAGECIVTLKSFGGQYIYVPTSKIQSYPNQSGLDYTSLVLGIKLGPIPNNLDLSVLRQKIHDDVMDYLGVDSVVQQAAISETVKKSAGDAAALEAARVANIREDKTDHAKLLIVTAQRDAMALHIQQLEQFIATNFPPQT